MYCLSHLSQQKLILKTSLSEASLKISDLGLVRVSVAVEAILLKQPMEYRQSQSLEGYYFTFYLNIGRE